jgi:hypothetical protein
LEPPRQEPLHEETVLVYVLDRVSVIRARPLEEFLEVVWLALAGAFLPFCLAATTSESPCHCFFLFFLEWLEVPSPASSSHCWYFIMHTKKSISALILL